MWQAAVEEWKKDENTQKALKISEKEKFKAAMVAWKAANGRGSDVGMVEVLQKLQYPSWQ